MEKFQLSLLFNIIGIGSASGLVYLDNKLYIISDSSSYLYEYHISDEKLNKIALVENAQENILKKDKPDFEAISKRDEELIILGSGSTENRERSFVYNTESLKVKEHNVKELFKLIKNQLHFADDEVNIEGLLFNEKGFYLFQRGNGKADKNGIIYVYGNRQDSKLTFTPFELPKIKNVPVTFTDAVLVDTTIYFLASAEDTTSTYLDGEVLGSIFGSIDLKTMKLINSVQITDKHKFEGLTLYKKSATQIEFLLCEDNDSELLESNIYKLTIRQKE